MFAMGAGLIISDFFVVLQDAISAVHSLVLVSMQPHSFRANKRDMFMNLGIWDYMGDTL
jgi:hypothetical protein